jgi:tRNA (adenine37-N6)-methyltransferase
LFNYYIILINGGISDMIQLKPIAFAYNSRKEMTDDFWGGVTSTIILVEELPEESLDGIDSFSHLDIIYHFNKVNEAKIIEGARHPRNDPNLPKVGIYSQRGKNRPNRIGLTSVELIGREGRKIYVKGLDCINGTPVLDIKPVMKEFLPKGTVKQPLWTMEIMKNYWE